MRSIATLESKHPQERTLPTFIGLEAQWRGKGIGSALMQPVLDRCDEEGVPAYLEATAPRNRALYERNGFMGDTGLEVASGPLLRSYEAC